jgi:hypothetical protein
MIAMMFVSDDHSLRAVDLRPGAPLTGMAFKSVTLNYKDVATLTDDEKCDWFVKTVLPRLTP